MPKWTVCPACASATVAAGSPVRVRFDLTFTMQLPSTETGESVTVRVRVRLEALDKIRAGRGLRSRYALAKRLGVSQSTVGRILDGAQAPGEQFIAATLHALDVPFDDVFEVVATTEDQP